MHKYCLYTILLLAACHSATTIKYPPGGYSYPESFSDKDTNFYFYPLKNIESRKDSFNDASDSDFFLSYHEPNLSIRPQPSSTFRLVYNTPFSYPVVITLTEHRIIVKQGTSYTDECQLLPDTTQLTTLEKFHWRILKRNFPIEPNGRRQQSRQHYLDSIGQLYLILHDPIYYRYLLSKVNAHKSPCITFRQRQTDISPAQFDSLVDEINTSGFWQLPHRIECVDYPMDGDGFIMEANTPEKYKVVFGSSCIDSLAFKKALQAIASQAGTDSLIRLATRQSVNVKH